MQNTQPHPTIAYLPHSHSQSHQLANPLYPMYPPIMSAIVHISCGLNFTFLLDTNMRLYSFGGNQWGQLGYDTQGKSVADIRNVQIGKKFLVQGVRCGFTHVVVYGDRDCYGWGEHQYGALGYEPMQVINSWMPRRLPILISPHEKLIDASCGNNTTVFNISQQFYCLGDNRLGQLGQILKKPIFEPEKIQISATKYFKASKLVSVKAGDGFTIGMDQNHQLFGAGQVVKLGLAIRNKNMLPTGLCQIQVPTKGGYTTLLNVQQYECQQKLIVKFADGDDRYIVFGNENGILYKSIKNQKDIKIVSMSQEFILLEDSENLYKWQIDGHQPDSLQALTDLEERFQKIDLIGCDQQGRIIIVNNSPSSQSREQTKNELMWSRNQSIKYEVENSKPTNGSLSSSSLEKQQIQSLMKQVGQQKQIIRLFEQYVARLETENAELKERLRADNVLEQDEDDAVSNGLTMLKVMIKDMLQEHTRNK